MLCNPLVRAAPGDRPSVFLQGASVPRAKALALDAALIKGWQVTSSEPNFVIFETKLEVPASVGPAGAIPPDRTLLRIRADFVETPAGVNTYLFAEEIWYAGTTKEWISDVTPQYRRNLANALSSLQSQWTQFSRNHPAKSRSATEALETQPKIRVAPTESRMQPRVPAPLRPPSSEAIAPTVVDVAVGTWAYHAEQFAVERGCSLNEIGAELISGDSASELHRVHCASGSSVLVRCDREACYGAR
ncbi:MAG: hypothetical protein WBG92_18295 [Thiohalocapsa sp.]